MHSIECLLSPGVGTVCFQLSDHRESCQLLLKVKRKKMDLHNEPQTVEGYRVESLFCPVEVRLQLKAATHLKVICWEHQSISGHWIYWSRPILAVKEAKDEGEPNFYIRLSEFKSLLHAGGLPLPGKTGFLLGSSGLLE